jgi:ribosomal protein L4
LIEKVKAGQVYVLEKPKLKEPKTKKMAAFFDQIELGNRRTLVLAEAKEEMGNPHENIMKSLRNLPKKEMNNMAQVNGYDIAKCHSLVLLDSAVDQFLSMLGAE